MSDSVPVRSAVTARSVCQAITNRWVSSSKRTAATWGFSSRFSSVVSWKVRMVSSLFWSSPNSPLGRMAATVSQSVLPEASAPVSRVYTTAAVPSLIMAASMPLTLAPVRGWPSTLLPPS